MYIWPAQDECIFIVGIKLSDLVTNYNEPINFVTLLLLLVDQCDQIWRNFATLAKGKNSLWQAFEGLLSVCQDFEPTLAQFCVFGQIFFVVNVKILKKI